VRLAERARRIAHHTHAAVQRAGDRLDARRDRVVAAPARVLDRHHQHLARSAGVLARRPAAVLDRTGERLDHAEARVRLLDPVNVLKRGWSITRDGDGNVVRSAADVAPGAALVTQVADGTITSTVDPA